MKISNQQATLGSQTYQYFCSAKCMTTALRGMDMEELAAIYGYTKDAPSTSIKWTAHQLVTQEVARRTCETSTEEGSN